MPLMHCVSNTAKNKCVLRRDLKQSEPSVGSRRWSGGEFQTIRPATENDRLPNCCDGNVAWRVDGGWQNGAAGDWQLQTLECSIRLDTAEPCLEDTGVLLLQVYAGYVQERQAEVTDGFIWMYLFKIITYDNYSN